MAQQQGNYPPRGGSQERRQGGYEAPAAKDWTADFLANWISDRLTDESITFAEKFGKHLKDSGFTTSQIRNVFGEIKRIQMAGFTGKEAQTDFLLLKPKMAYAAKRATDKDRPTQEADDFEKVMKKAHETVAGDLGRFENFCDFIEAVLAYHKAAGGRD